jgi:hypothetical protein
MLKGRTYQVWEIYWMWLKISPVTALVAKVHSLTRTWAIMGSESKPNHGKRTRSTCLCRINVSRSWRQCPSCECWIDKVTPYGSGVFVSDDQKSGSTALKIISNSLMDNTTELCRVRTSPGAVEIFLKRTVRQERSIAGSPHVHLTQDAQLLCYAGSLDINSQMPRFFFFTCKGLWHVHKAKSKFLSKIERFTGCI